MQIRLCYALHPQQIVENRHFGRALCTHLPVDVVGKFMEQRLKIDKSFGRGNVTLLEIAINGRSISLIQLLNKYDYDFQTYCTMFSELFHDFISRCYHNRNGRIL